MSRKLRNPIPGSGSLRYSPATQSVPIGFTASLTAMGVSPYTWTAPGSTNPGPVTGSSFSTTYSSMGTKTVTVTIQGGGGGTPRLVAGGAGTARW